MARILFGPSGEKIAGWAMIFTMLGFVISFIAFIKSVIPHTINTIINSFK